MVFRETGCRRIRRRPPFVHMTIRRARPRASHPVRRHYGAAISIAFGIFCFHAPPVMAQLAEAATPADMAGAPPSSPGEMRQSEIRLPESEHARATLGRALGDKGIYLSSTTTAIGATIASGGLKKGVYGVFQHTFGTDIELEPLAGIPNTVVHFTVVKRYGESNNRAYHGSAYAGLAIAGPVKVTRLTEFSIDVSLFHDKLRLLGGRAPSATEYGTSDLYCRFTAGICGHIAPYAWARNSNSGFWPLASWTARATLKPTPNSYVRVGLSDVNTTGYARAGFPWNGGWRTKDSIGTFIPVEVGYRSSFADDSHPRAFNVGGFFDTSPYDDPYFNTEGLSRTLFGGTPLRHKGRASVYAQAQQMVWRPDRGSSRGAHLFGATMMNVYGVGQTKLHFLAGVVASGPFDARLNDSFSLMAFTNILDRRVRDDYQASLIKTGQSGTAPRRETVIEANYSFGLSPGLQLRPFVQYIDNPDQIGFRPVVSSNRNALIVGTQFSASLADVFGLPAFQRKR